jgi:hypothetical protein
MILEKSPHVDTLINPDNFFFLSKAYKKLYWLETEQVVALIKTEPTADDAGRQGEWRHVLLIPIMEYLSATNPFNHFSHHFITASDNPPEKLESVTLEK